MLVIIFLASSPVWAIQKEFEMAGTVEESSAKGLLDCSNVISISCGDVVTGNNGPDGNVDEFGCDSYPYVPGSGEDVYVISLEEGAFVNATVVVEPPYANLLYVLGVCDEDVCLFFGPGGTSFFVPATADYYFVIDTYGGAGLPYTLSVECFPYEPPPINDTCFNGTCLPPTLPGITGSFAGNLRWTVDDLDFDYACYINWGVTADVVYEFALENEDTFTATVSSGDDTDITLAIVTDCQDSDTCVTGVDMGFPGDPETITWTNNSGELTLYYLIVKDFARTTAGSFTGEYTHDGVFCEDPVSTTEKSWGSVKALYK